MMHARGLLPKTILLSRRIFNNVVNECQLNCNNLLLHYVMHFADDKYYTIKLSYIILGKKVSVEIYFSYRQAWKSTETR